MLPGTSADIETLAELSVKFLGARSAQIPFEQVIHYSTWKAPDADYDAEIPEISRQAVARECQTDSNRSVEFRIFTLIF